MEEKIKLKRNKSKKGFIKHKYPHPRNKTCGQKIQKQITYEKILTNLKDIYDVCDNFLKSKSKKIKEWNISERENCMNITIIFKNNKPLEISILFFKNKKSDFFFKDAHSQSVHMTIFQSIEESVFSQKLNCSFNTRYFGYFAEEEVINILLKNIIGKDFISVDFATNEQDRLENTDIILKYQKGNKVKDIPIDIKLNKRAANYTREKAPYRATLTFSLVKKILSKNNGKYILIDKLKKLAEDYFNRKIPWQQKEIFL